MRRPTVNLLIDGIALLLMMCMAATGLVMKVVLPPGSGGASVWSMTRHDWGDAHFWLAAGFVLLLAVHLALHWTWVCGTLRNLSGRRVDSHGRAGASGEQDAAVRVGRARHATWYGLSLLGVVAAALVIFVCVAIGQVEGTRSGERGGQGAGQRHGATR